jgi:hypothetical protein
MKTLVTILMITLAQTMLFAQPGGDGPKQDRKEFIRSQKIAFIATELALTPEEAEVFWPVYNEYDAKMETLREERKGYTKELRTMDEITDDRAYELTELILATEKKEVELRSEYLIKFAEVLDKKKAAKVFMAEEKFKRELMDHINQQYKKPHDGPKQD